MIDGFLLYSRLVEPDQLLYEEEINSMHEKTADKRNKHLNWIKMLKYFHISYKYGFLPLSHDKLLMQSLESICMHFSLWFAHKSKAH